MKRLILLLALIGLAMPSVAQAPPEDIFREAQELFERGDYEAAIERYNALVRDYPLSELIPDAQFRRAVSLYRLGRYDEALSLLRRIEARYRSSAFLGVVPFWKGLSLYRMEDYGAAAQELGRFIELRGSAELEAQARVYKALSENALDARTAAIETLQPLFEPVPTAALGPDRSYAAALLMSYYVQTDRQKQAIALHQELDPSLLAERWRTRYVLSAAESYYAEEQYQVARELFLTLRDAEVDAATVAFQRLFQIARREGEREELRRVLAQAEERLAGQREVLGDLWLRVGIESYEAGELEIAELYIRRVWDIDPTDSTVALYLAELLKRRGEASAAIRVLVDHRDAVAEPEPQVLLRLGTLYVETEEWEDAAAVLAELKEQFPDSSYISAALYQQSYALSQLDRIDEALSVVEEALAGGQSGAYLPELLRLKASLHRERGELVQADQALRDYLAIRSDDLDASVEGIKVLFQRELYDAVSDRAAKLVEGHPSLEGNRPELYVQLQYMRGLAAIARQEYELGLQYLSAVPTEEADSALSSESRNVIVPYALYYRGWGSFRIGAYRDAVSAFDSLISSYGEHEFANRSAYLAGWSAFNENDYESAQRYFQQLLAFQPDQALRIQGYFLLGQTLKARERYEEALIQYRNVFADFPNSRYADDALFEYAGVLVTTGSLDRAVREYKNLFQTYPESPLAEEGMYRRAELLYEEERYADARDAFFEYRSNFPSGRLHDAALYWGGMASTEVGEPAGALLLWERLIEQYRNSPFRPDAMQRTAQLYEEQGEYRKALNTWSSFIATYPERARAVGATRRADELVLQIGGLTEREARLWVRIEEANRAETERGREAIIELGRLLIYEGGGAQANQNLVLPMLEEVLNKADAAPQQAGEAAFLLAESHLRRSQPEQAAEYFLRAAGANPENADFVARSLFRAAEMMHAADMTAQRDQIIRRLQENFPESEWTEQASRLQENPQ